MRSLLLKLCFLQIVVFVFGFNGLTSLYNTHIEPPIDSDDYKSTIQFSVKEKWIEQKLDNFNADDSRVWSMRYLENNRWFQPGGPIFIYIGGEWEISPGWISAGLMFDMARELNGTMFYTEHRYYGKSLPTNDTSTTNLKFLTVEQALADLAHFIEFVKESYAERKSSGVIAVGASYSATLATWARLKYPQLINGAWASSAPIYAKLDFYEYNEVMTESIKIAGGEKCVEKFEDAFKELELLVEFSDSEKMTKIENNFQLCEPLNLSRDVEHFFYELSDVVAGMVQSHKREDIQKGCEFMLDTKHSDSVSSLGAWLNSRKKFKCLNMNYEDTIRKFKNVTWGSAANKQLRQWTYQTCDRFGWFQTGSSKKQVFGSKFVKSEYFIKMCADLFDNQFDYQKIEQNVKETNDAFGGFTPQITNVYSSHGQLDPWRAMGLQKDLNPDAPSIVIESYSHVPDLLSISANDTPQMKASKERVKVLVKQWLNLND